MQVSVCGDKAAKPFFDGNLLGAKCVINDGYIERNVFVVVYFRRGTYECPNGAALEVTDAQRRGVRLLSARAEKHKSSKSRHVFRLNVRNIFPYFSVPSLTKRDGTRVVPLCKRASHAALTPDTLSIAPTHQTFLPFRGVTPTLLFKLKTALDKNHIETTQTTPRQAISISQHRTRHAPRIFANFKWITHDAPHSHQAVDTLQRQSWDILERHLLDHTSSQLLISRQSTHTPANQSSLLDISSILFFFRTSLYEVKRE